MSALDGLRALTEERSAVVTDGGDRGRYTTDEILENAASLRTSILSVLGIEEL